jgi:hypothetical protein
VNDHTIIPTLHFSPTRVFDIIGFLTSKKRSFGYYKEFLKNHRKRGFSNIKIKSNGEA